MHNNIEDVTIKEKERSICPFTKFPEDGSTASQEKFIPLRHKQLNKVKPFISLDGKNPRKERNNIMPAWNYICLKCGKGLVDHRVSSIKDKVVCECGEPMERQPNFNVSIHLGYEVPAYKAPPQHICDDPREYYG